MPSHSARFSGFFDHGRDHDDASRSRGAGNVHHLSHQWDHDADRDGFESSCHHEHDHHQHHGHSGGGTGSSTGPITSGDPPPSGLTAIATALQEAATIQAGAQGQTGEIIPPNLGNLPPGDPAAGVFVRLTGVQNNVTSVLGDGSGDAISLDTGDTNILHAGNGTGDQLTINTGSNNDLGLGDGAGDSAVVDSGNNNNLVVGNGDGDGVSIGTGTSNNLTVGNGAGDGVSVSNGDNNLMAVGNGTGDFLQVLKGNHNSLDVGNGATDVCLVNTGNDNLLHVGDGLQDVASILSGNSNVLITGNGDGDVVNVGSGNGNVLALGDGVADQLTLGSGDNNVLLDGNGANDTILIGGVVGKVGTGIDSNNSVVIGNGDGDQAWGSLGNGNSYLTGAGNDLVHTGGGNDFVYVDNHLETATPADPFHLTSTDSQAQNLFGDGGSDVFALQGAQQGSGLGTTVMTGGGGVEKYWVSGLWGDAVVTDFNAAAGDRLMLGGVSAATIANLGTVHLSYIHSAYDTTHSGAVDLLINFGSSANTAQSITLLDFQPQDTGGSGGSEQFNNVTFSNPHAAEAVLSHIFDFAAADNQAVTTQIASLATQHLILH